MPVQKGKKRRRRLRRGLHGEGDELPRPAPAAPQKGSARPVMRRGWQAPLWVNLAVGTGLVVAGLVFFLLPGKGTGTGQRLIFLLLYFALAGLYYGKAIRQWRTKQQR